MRETDLPCSIRARASVCECVCVCVHALREDLEAFAVEMEQAYKPLQSKTMKQLNTAADYPELPTLQQRLEWFEERQHFAKSVLRRASGPSNPKRAKKAKVACE